MIAHRTLQHSLLGGGALLVAGSALLTIVDCQRMAAMGGMPMPGGWTMSMAWMRMPGQTWLAAAASFVGMWAPMMIAMMLPVVTPHLWRYQQALAGAGWDSERAARRTAAACAAYLLLWATIGAVIYPLGLALAMMQMSHPMLARQMPMGLAVSVLVIGGLQFSPWKVRQLDGCRPKANGICSAEASARSAWCYGLKLGLQCVRCCANLMAIPLVLGVMDLGAMGAATAAIWIERTLPGGRSAARIVGTTLLAAGLCLMAKALG